MPDTSKTAYANPLIMMADYIQSIVKNYVASNYNLNQLQIEGGHFIFIDYLIILVPASILHNLFC
jgi:hypothetical protein